MLLAGCDTARYTYILARLRKLANCSSRCSYADTVRPSTSRQDTSVGSCHSTSSHWFSSANSSITVVLPLPDGPDRHKMVGAYHATTTTKQHFTERQPRASIKQKTAPCAYIGSIRLKRLERTPKPAAYLLDLSVVHGNRRLDRAANAEMSTMQAVCVCVCVCVCVFAGASSCKRCWKCSYELAWLVLFVPRLRCQRSCAAI